MGAVGTFLLNLWNGVVSLAPVIFHAACEIVEKTSQVVTLPK